MSNTNDIIENYLLEKVINNKNIQDKLLRKKNKLHRELKLWEFEKEKLVKKLENSASKYYKNIKSQVTEVEITIEKIEENIKEINKYVNGVNISGKQQRPTVSRKFKRTKRIKVKD